VFERYIGEIAKAINSINGTDAKKLYEALLKEARKRTAIADAQLDEEGKTVKKDETEELKNDEGVVMVESRAAHLKQEAPDGQTTSDSATASAESNGDGDVVRLNGKPKKKAKKKSAEERGLF
jgi:hypothetical protein